MARGAAQWRGLLSSLPGRTALPHESRGIKISPIRECLGYCRSRWAGGAILLEMYSVGPISEMESVSIIKTAAPSVGGQGTMRSARTPPSLGTRQNARSDAGITMWHAAVWRGRACQVLELGEPGVADGTTADSLAADRRGPPQDGQAGRSKLLARSCLRILVRGLGPSRDRRSRNRPLAQAQHLARLARGWAGHPGRSRPT